jgi:RHS repeat-associated protein
MPNSDGIFADPKAKSVLVKRPGNNEYLLLTRGIDTKLYYHTIAMDMPGNGTINNPKGEVTAKNQPLDALAGYGRHFAAVEDYVNNKTILYASKYAAATNLGTTGLVRFELSNDENNNSLLVTKTTERTYSSLDVEGEGDIQISPDGSRLIVYNHKENVGWSAQQLAEIRSYTLSNTYQIITVQGVTQESVTAIDRGTVPESSADISKDSKYVYYTQKEIAYNISPTTYQAVYKLNLLGGTPDLVKANSYGNIRRGKDKNVYTANLGQVLINSYNIDIFGTSTEDLIKTITISNPTTGALPLQVHKVYNKLPEQEQYLYRIAGKKVYELKDHLGNVTVVVSDVKEVILTASTITGYEASVVSYTHYYAFGMAMPGRTYNSPEYRYGFNGMEKDNELKGNGNSYDFGARIYDPRLGKWWKIDLYDKEMANITPYRFGFNNPIRYSDGDGEFEIDEATAKAYPKLNAYLKNVSEVYANKPEEFRKAFKKYSELSDEQIKSMLEYKLVKTGSPLHKNQLNPRIEVKQLPSANGQTSQTVQMEGGAIKSISNVGSITLDKDIVDELEKGHGTNVEREAANLVIESTLFHEATHYGDALSDNQLTKTGI